MALRETIVCCLAGKIAMPTSLPKQNSAATDKRSYYADDFKIVPAIVLLVVIVILSFLIIIFYKHSYLLKICAMAALLSGIPLLISGSLYYRRGPVITLTNKGFLVPGFVKEFIPWTAVTQASKFYFYGLSVVTPMYKVEIDPSYAKNLTRQGIWRLWLLIPSRRRRSPTLLYLPLAAISDEPDVIFAEFTRRLAEGKRSP
jgi:hypothetical protein